MSGESGAQKTLAVLIDADNANPGVVTELFAEIAAHGTASIRRAYGDWTTPQLSGWKAALLDHSIQPMQQFANTRGKNATDGAMIIDAMDLLHTRRLDGFCIVSSDSDFTALARRIRESGLLVIGFGERKTPKPFIAACDRFIHTELLRPAPAEAAPAPKRDAALLRLIRRAVEAVSDETGWAALGGVGSTIVKQQPDFDPRAHGHAKLSGLVKALPEFEVEERKSGQGKSLYIRDARQRG